MSAMTDCAAAFEIVTNGRNGPFMLSITKKERIALPPTLSGPMIVPSRAKLSLADFASIGAGRIYCLHEAVTIRA